MFLSCPILSCQRRTTYSDDTDKRIAAASMVVAETSSENPTVAIHRGFHMIIFCTPLLIRTSVAVVAEGLPAVCAAIKL